MSLTQHAFLAAILGLLSHHGLFICGEHHLRAAVIFRMYLFLAASVYIIETLWHGELCWQAQIAAFTVICTYAIALFGSIMTYRAFFHPLRRFPGPRLAAISKFWNVLKALDSTNYRLMEDLHNSYGDFVRTGMN